MKVTFDKNVYEFVVDPQKKGNIETGLRDCYKKINSLIHVGFIQPFISETILTYEVLSKAERKTILSHNQPIIVSSDNDKISISSNPNIHPGNTSYDDIYLPKAIEMGFKILPDRRFGKLLNPAVQSKWYYLPNEDFFTTTDRFGLVEEELNKLNVGYMAYRNALGISGDAKLRLFEIVERFSGGDKKLSAALSERSDGDSVALHIANKIDYFCTLDKGANAKRSVFSNDVCLYLKEKFSFQKVTPMELLGVREVIN